MVNLLALVAAAVAALVVSGFGKSLAALIAAGFLALGALVALVSWFQMRLEDREQQEKLELDELARSRGSATLFEGRDVETFPAQQARVQFEKYFVPGFTAALFLLEGAGAWVSWRLLGKITVISLQNLLMGMGLYGLAFLILFMLGKYAAGIARLESQRLVRPGAGWLLLGAYLCLLVTGGFAGAEAGFGRADFYLARGLTVLLGLLALETLAALVFEIYRPRLKGKVIRPLYDSRLVGLLAHPEGLFTTAARTLDYQFGFKVSETWAYQMFAEKLPAFLLGLAAVLVLSSSFVFLEPGEQALLERFGHATGEPLGPGPHLKFPWPVDKIYRFNTGEVKSFNVGFVPDPRLENATTLLWTVTHYKEEFDFLVASHDQSEPAATNDTAGQQSVPVNLLDAGIPVQFRITDVRAWAYGHADAQTLLEQLATREVSRYLASVDLLDIMSVGREAAADELKKRIQARADELKLGVDVLFVGLQDIHPPVAVASAFEDVNGAAQEVQARVLGAEGETNRIILLAEADANEQILGAEGAAVRATTGAAAQAARFANQIAAYKAAPDVYPSRLYLETVARATVGTRKYIIAPTNTQDVIQIDLEDKLRPDLFEVPVEPPKK
jgi:regulator of protease activity HflC (stomatin/prohibitin superfamily)